MRLQQATRVLRQTAANHGWKAAVGLARGRLAATLRRSPSPVSGAGWQATAEHTFDRLYGVETSGLIHGTELRTGSPHDVWNTAYYAIGPSVFHRAMARLPAALLPDATFLDLGCGKGRAVLLAAQYPFRRVIGVELVPELYQAAVANLARFAAPPPLAPVQIVHGDAAEYAFPDGPLVVYLYHPFCRPVLERVLLRLGASLEREPREVAVVYINDELSSALNRVPWLTKTWSATVEMDAEDCLADRVGSSAEDCSIYRAGF